MPTVISPKVFDICSQINIQVKSVLLACSGCHITVTHDLRTADDDEKQKTKIKMF